MPIHLRRMRLSIMYALKLRACPYNPAFKCVFQPKYQAFYCKRKKPIFSFGFRVEQHLEKLCIDLTGIAPFRFPKKPPWEMSKPFVRFDLCQIKKSETNPLIFQSRFREILHDFEPELEIYTDGSKTRDGSVGAGVYSKDGCVICKLPDNSSVFSAEVEAIKRALKIVLKSKKETFMIFSDSLSALQSIDNLHWEHPGVCDVLELFSKSFEEDKCVNFCWIPSHIGICGNEHADFAAKTATKLPSCSCVVSPTVRSIKVTLPWLSGLRVI